MQIGLGISAHFVERTTDDCVWSFAFKEKLVETVSAFAIVAHLFVSFFSFFV